MIVKHQFRFEAAHHLPRHPGKCFHPHGHSYRFELALDVPVDPATGMTIDFYEIASAVRSEVLDIVDHKDLNDLIENPTAENIVTWMWRLLVRRLPGLRSLELWEVDGCSVVYRGEETSAAAPRGGEAP